MAEQRDIVLIEQAKIERQRLGAALLYGYKDERRTVNDHMKRLIGSVIVTAVACGVCVGVSFVVQLLSAQAAEKAEESALVAVVQTTEAL